MSLNNAKGNIGRGGQTLSLRHGDSFEILKGFPDETLGAVVTDPPYL